MFVENAPADGARFNAEVEMYFAKSNFSKQWQCKDGKKASQVLKYQNMQLLIKPYKKIREIHFTFGWITTRLGEMKVL